MNILCEIKSPCPSQKREDGKDICIEEEGKCEYQRLEEAGADAAQYADQTVMQYGA